MRAAWDEHTVMGMAAYGDAMPRGSNRSFAS
jgi:hypothetical protein